MLLFKYPLQYRAYKQIKAEVWESTQGGDEAFKQVSDEEIEALARERLFNEGVTTELDKVICEDYTEEEIKNDREAIDWETAYEEVQKIEEEQKAAQLKIIQEQERARIAKEFELKQ